MSSAEKLDSRELRVFLSSTFRDFQPERELLINKVLPEVRAIARTRGVELTVIDLRWGLTDEQAELGGAVTTCLREVENSRPHFIGLLGERYGWRPSATEWRLDHTAPDLSERIRSWIDKGQSVTAMEILYGVLDCPEERPLAYFYLRNPSLTRQLLVEDKEHAAAYLEADPEAAERQQELRRRIRNESVDKGWHSRDYAVLQDDPLSFAAQIKADLLRDLDNRFPSGEQLSERERMNREHRIYAHDRLSQYVEPQGFIDQAFRVLESDHHLLLSGPSGIGKSSAVAALVQRFRKSYPDALVIEHYPGAAPGCTSEAILLRALIEIQHRLNLVEKPSKGDELEKDFLENLKNLNDAGIRTLLAIDALNQVEINTNMNWLHNRQQPTVHLLVSSQPDDDTNVFSHKGWSLQEIPPLTPALRRQLAKDLLGGRHKILADTQLDRIEQKEAASTPLYLKVLLEELVAFGGLSGGQESQDQFMARILTGYLACDDIPGLYHKLLERLEQNYGREIVATFLGLIASSRSGLSEDELICIGDLSPLLLAQLRHTLDFNLANRDGLIGFGHQALEIAASARYVSNDVYKKLADHFYDQPDKYSSPRIIKWLPFYLVQCNQIERLDTYVSGVHFKYIDNVSGAPKYIYSGRMTSIYVSPHLDYSFLFRISPFKSSIFFRSLKDRLSKIKVLGYKSDNEQIERAREYNKLFFFLYSQKLNSREDARDLLYSVHDLMQEGRIYAYAEYVDFSGPTMSTTHYFIENIRQIKKAIQGWTETATA